MLLAEEGQLNLSACETLVKVCYLSSKEITFLSLLVNGVSEVNYLSKTLIPVIVQLGNVL